MITALTTPEDPNDPVECTARKNAFEKFLTQVRIYARFSNRSHHLPQLDRKSSSTRETDTSQLKLKGIPYVSEPLGKVLDPLVSLAKSARGWNCRTTALYNCPQKMLDEFLSDEK